MLPPITTQLGPLFEDFFFEPDLRDLDRLPVVRFDPEVRLPDDREERLVEPVSSS